VPFAHRKKDPPRSLLLERDSYLIEIPFVIKARFLNEFPVFPVSLRLRSPSQ
jgi:hypothetical protein